MENKPLQRTADARDIPAIQRIVQVTWPVTYGPILEISQISYMLDLIYNKAALLDQMEQGHKFFMLQEGERPVGFIDVQKLTDNSSKLHKIYLLPDCQGKGYGRLLMDYAIHVAKENGSAILLLNVNRYNPALAFYRKMGFFIREEVDIPIGQGYFMNDYVMELAL